MSDNIASTKTAVADLQAALAETFSDQRWLAVLELALPTGVCSTQHMQQLENLSRGQVNRLLARFEELAPRGILIRVALPLVRAGQRGQPPAVYKLGDQGAALLRANGYPQAHACQLTETTALAHALATLDVRLAAIHAGLAVQTEKPLPYYDTALRPDNLLTLPNGLHAIFETEQAATLPLLRRIRDSVRHKVAFFQSAGNDRPRISPNVRVLFNLTRGKTWEQTVNVWERATALVANESGGELPFNIVGMPLVEFLASPDWGEPPDRRWEALFDPSSGRSFTLAPATTTAEPATTKPAVQQSGSTKLAKSTSSALSLPATLKRRTPRDDYLIIQAYQQYVTENGTVPPTADTPNANPLFFSLMSVIWAASYPPDATPWQLAQHPHASLYLLAVYLRLHPQPKVALKKAIEGRSNTITWNPTTILHRMQVVINRFLDYHGLRCSSGLRAYPTSNWGRASDSMDFGVTVTLHADMLIGDESGVLPSRDELRRAEQALAWVLYTLFAYSDAIGLELRQEHPPFW